MKQKLFSIFCCLLLSASMVTQAQLRDAVNDSPEGGYIPESANFVSGRNNAPEAIQAYYYCFYQEPAWIRIDQKNSNSSTVFQILFCTSDGAVGRFDQVTLAGTNDIRGSFSFNSIKVSNSSNYNYTIAQKASGYYYAEPMYGTIEFVFTGNYDGDGDPIYTVYLDGTVDSYTPAYGSRGRLYASWSGDLGVAFYNYSGTKTTLKALTTITGAANNDSYGTVSGSGSYNYGAQIELVATPKPGYAFVKWADNNSTDPHRIVAVGNNDVTYTANFAVPSEGTITATASNGTVRGSVNESGRFVSGTNYPGGTQIWLKPVANDGYYFTQWSDGVKDNPRLVVVNGTATYTAQFAVRDFTLDVGWEWSNWTKHSNVVEGANSTCYDYTWRDSDGDFVSLTALFSKYRMQTVSGYNFMPNGTYNIIKTAAELNTVAGGNGWTFSGPAYRSSAQCGENTGIYLNSGTVTVIDGKDGKPYVQVIADVDFSASKTRYSAFFRVGHTTPLWEISFVDGDGNTVQTNTYLDGATPSYGGSDPTKSDDAQYTYTFTGWSPDIGTATADQVYTAQFSSSPKVTNYNLTFSAGANGEVTGTAADADIAAETTHSLAETTPISLTT